MEFAVREGEIFEKMVLIPGVIEVKFDQQILFNVPRKKKNCTVANCEKEATAHTHITSSYKSGTPYHPKLGLYKGGTARRMTQGPHPPLRSPG